MPTTPAIDSALRELGERISALEALGRSAAGNPGPSRKAGDVALKEHLEARLAAQQEYFEAKLAASDQATRTATSALDRRLEGMNEFRGALADSTARLATRAELESQAQRITAELALRVERFTQDIAELRKFQNTMEGKASAESVGRAQILAVIGILLSVVMPILLKLVIK